MGIFWVRGLLWRNRVVLLALGPVGAVGILTFSIVFKLDYVLIYSIYAIISSTYRGPVS